MRIAGYSEVAFANNDDLSSQLGRIIFISNTDENAPSIIFKRYKSRHITFSVHSAEVISFADLFDEALVIKNAIEMAISNSVQLHLLTDSKILFDIISKGSRTYEKRKMLDVYAARQAYKEQDISNIGFVRSKQNMADGRTRSMNQEALRNVINIRKLSIKIEQWIIRKPKNAHKERSYRCIAELLIRFKVE